MRDLLRACPECDEDVEIEEFADVIGDRQIGTIEECKKCGYRFEPDQDPNPDGDI